MKAVFLSDAHLKRALDERYGQLIRFLTDLQDGKVRELLNNREPVLEKTKIDDLYILGDFFDFWFCEPHRIHPEFQIVIGKLIELQKSGIRIHFCEGNHDFFLKEYFQDVLGMEVFDEWATVDMDHRQILIAHGDTADPSDRAYLLFRKILRSRPFYRIQRLLPASIRWAIAGMSSSASKQINEENGDYLVEKMLSFASDKLRDDFDAVILGHCHKPVLRHFDVEGKKKTFVTLGDWITHYSFLYYENGKFFLSYYLPR